MKKVLLALTWWYFRIQRESSSVGDQLLVLFQSQLALSGQAQVTAETNKNNCKALNTTKQIDTQVKSMQKKMKCTSYENKTNAGMKDIHKSTRKWLHTQFRLY